MKFQIPDKLKEDVPQTFWGKILTATPVVMTVIATMLAGLASSEMTRAQYDRSQAAQQQSKAGDQWGFFQAKRLRGALQRSTLDVLQSTATVHPLAPQALAGTDAVVLAVLQGGDLPAWPKSAAPSAALQAALAAVESSQPEPAVTALLANVDDKMLAQALRAAQDDARAFDTALAPVNQGIDRLEKSLAGADRDFIAARLRYTARRYDAEARLNQAIANLYELQVRQSNHTAERHHRRSQRFFFGMLAAQAAVIIATFAIAARKRNLLWALAAAAGSAAIGFAVYVYLFV